MVMPDSLSAEELEWITACVFDPNCGQTGSFGGHCRWCKIRAYIAALQSRVDELEADRGRLDWEQAQITVDDGRPRKYKWNVGLVRVEAWPLDMNIGQCYPTYRAALDAAMRGKEQG